MPGGKGNIRPEDGKQFSSTYQPKEKWTEKKALELGNEMIAWLNEVDDDGNDVGNILFEEFLVIKKGLYNEIINYLKVKFTSFLKLYGIAKKTQEIKITKYGLADKLNASMAKFILSANHGLSEHKKEDPPKDTAITFNFGNDSIKLSDLEDDS